MAFLNVTQRIHTSIFPSYIQDILEHFEQNSYLNDFYHKSNASREEGQNL